MMALNQKLGVTDRVQGGFFTAMIAEEGGGQKFEVTMIQTNRNRC